MSIPEAVTERQWRHAIPHEVYERAQQASMRSLVLGPDKGLVAANVEAFKVIAAWARNEALREAAKVARTTTEIPMHSQWGNVIAEAILELVKEEA